MYPVVEEISVKSLLTGDDSLLHFSVNCKSLASQVLLKGSKGTKVTNCHIWSIWQYGDRWFLSLWAL